VANSRYQLSQRIYDIHWEDYFPWKFEGHEARAADPELCYAFIQLHREEFKLLAAGDGFFDEMSNPRRQKYYEVAGDFFSYYVDNKMVGFFIGTPVDWSTYYIRFVWILSEHRKKGFYQNFLGYLLAILSRHGIARTQIDIAPSNLAHMHILNKLKFNTTGFSLSERWGALVHLTRFLDVESAEVFLNRYCVGVKPQLDSTASQNGDVGLQFDLKDRDTF
jgi:hypothetical protein